MDLWHQDWFIESRGPFLGGLAALVVAAVATKVWKLAPQAWLALARLGIWRTTLGLVRNVGFWLAFAQLATTYIVEDWLYRRFGLPWALLGIVSLALILVLAYVIPILSGSLAARTLASKQESQVSFQGDLKPVRIERQETIRAHVLKALYEWARIDSQRPLMPEEIVGRLGSSGVGFSVDLDVVPALEDLRDFGFVEMRWALRAARISPAGRRFYEDPEIYGNKNSLISPALIVAVGSVRVSDLTQASERLERFEFTIDFAAWFKAVSNALSDNEHISGVGNPQTLIYDTPSDLLMYFEQVGDLARVRIVRDRIDGTGRRAAIDIDLRRTPADAAKDIATVFRSFQNRPNGS